MRWEPHIFDLELEILSLCYKTLSQGINARSLYKLLKRWWRRMQKNRFSLTYVQTYSCCNILSRAPYFYQQIKKTPQNELFIYFYGSLVLPFFIASFVPPLMVLSIRANILHQFLLPVSLAYSPLYLKKNSLLLFQPLDVLHTPICLTSSCVDWRCVPRFHRVVH